MFCSNCGTQLSDNARFCHNCGNAVQIVQVANIPMSGPVIGQGSTVDTISDPAPTVIPEAPTHEELCLQNTKVKNKSVLPVVICLIACVAIFGLLAALVIGVLSNSVKEVTNAPIEAYVDDGVAYICYDDGKIIKLNGMYGAVYITPDRTKIICVQADSDDDMNLFWMDIDMEGKYLIAKCDVGNEEIETDEEFGITNEFIVYGIETEDSYKFYRYQYATDEIVYLYDSDKDQACYTYDSENFSCAKVVNGEIQLLSPEEKKFKTIFTCTDGKELSLEGVSVNGKYLLWQNLGNYKSSLFIYHNGEVEEICDVYGNEKVTYVLDATINGDAAIIYGGEVTAYIMDGEVTVTQFLSSIKDCCLSSGESCGNIKKISREKGYYVEVAESDELNSIYFIEFSTGEHIKLLSNIEYFSPISEKKIVYIDGENDLYCAESTIKSEIVGDIIDTNVESFACVISEGIENIYYAKNYSLDGYDLYVYRIAEDRCDKIDSNIFYIELSVENDSIMYVKDVEIGEYGLSSKGTLYKYNVAEEDSTIVATDVFYNTLDSGLDNMWIYSNSFFFLRYIGETEYEYIVDVCYYNGERYKTIVDRLELYSYEID